MEKRTLDIFITHAWYFHEDWNQLSQVLNQSLGKKWRNFSVPWHDPAMVPYTEVGKKFILSYLESQIIPADAVILLYGVFAKSKTFRNWLEIEVELARKHQKPIIGVPAANGGNVDEIPDNLVDLKVAWDSDQIVNAIYKLSGVMLKV